MRFSFTKIAFEKVISKIATGLFRPQIHSIQHWKYQPTFSYIWYEVRDKARFYQSHMNRVAISMSRQDKALFVALCHGRSNRCHQVTTVAFQRRAIRDGVHISQISQRIVYDMQFSLGCVLKAMVWCLFYNLALNTIDCSGWQRTHILEIREIVFYYILYTTSKQFSLRLSICTSQLG